MKKCKQVVQKIKISLFHEEVQAGRGQKVRKDEITFILEHKYLKAAKCQRAFSSLLDLKRGEPNH